MFPVERVDHNDEAAYSAEYKMKKKFSRIKQNLVLLPGGEELEYLTFPILEETGLVRHLFTTRLGGVSQHEFASMNFSVDRGDTGENVAANYERIAGVLEIGRAHV